MKHNRSWNLFARSAVLVSSATLFACCSSAEESPVDTTQDSGTADSGTADTESPDSGTADVAPDSPVDGGIDASKSAQCASQFGDKLTNAFGRVDGTVLAVVGTKDTQCPLVNNDHVVIQIVMEGAVYRLVASVLSTKNDPNVGFLTKEAPLTAPAWSEGWHTDSTLDYVSNLSVHTGEFTGHPMAELEKIVADEIEIGSKISVYATSSGGSYAGSAHLIHRNKPNMDGAIVVRPQSANPKYLLFRFADQNF